MASAADIGRVKTVSGTVHIERGGQRLPAAVDARVQPGDTLVTGAKSSVGITFLDNSRLSTGPDSTLVIDRYTFNQTTHAGTMNATLKKGTLGIISGRMAKQSPDAMTVRTTTMVLGIRGTELLVSAE
jgi:hypothetical protein